MPRELKPCGTYAAYERHRVYGEDPCELCADAMRARSRVLYARRKGGRVRRWGPPRCGTSSGWVKHMGDGTAPCDACREAHRLAMANHRARRRDPIRQPDAIVDMLVTQDRWLSTAVLVDLVLDLHPEWSAAALRRAADRLASRGIVRRRMLFGAAEFRADWDAWEAIA